MTRTVLHCVTTLCLLCFCSQIAAQSEPTAINVKAGQLSELFKGHEGAKHLILTGELNTADFGFLREQSGIEILDLSGVSIVLGGKYIGNAYLGEEVEGAANTLPDFFLFDNAADDLLRPLGRTLTTLLLPNDLVAIGRRALQGAKIKEIGLPSGIKTMGDMALGYCAELEDITLPDECLSFGSSVFAHCKKLKAIELPDGLRTISPFFLQGCDALTEVSLPLGVDSIKAGAFQGCIALESVDINKRTELKFVGNFAFKGCKSLTSIQLGYMLDSIGRQAFEGCSSLRLVTLPSPRLRTISDECFKGCASLESFVIPAQTTYIGPFAFSGCEKLSSVIWPSALETIMGGAFARTAIAQLVLPPSTKLVGYAAFVDCASLTRVVLPSALQRLGEHAFGRCSSLMTIEMPAIEPPIGGIDGLEELIELPLYVPEESVEKYKAAEAWKVMKKIQADKIYTYALSDELSLQKAIGHTALEQIGRMKLSGSLSEESAQYLKILPRLYDLDLSDLTIGTPIPATEYTPQLRRLVLQKQMPALPEAYCTRMTLLQEVVLPEGLQSIGMESFEDCSALSKINIPSTVTEIGDAAFMGCSALRYMELPQAVSLVSDMAFFGCARLDSIALGQDVAELGEQSFTNCVSLVKLSLPSTLNEIKDMAFYGCDSLKRIDCYAITPPEVADQEGSAAFSPYHYEQVVLYVLQDAKPEYEEDEVWTKFAIKELSTTHTEQIRYTPIVWTVSGGVGYAELRKDTSRPLAFEIFDLTGRRLIHDSFNAQSYRITLPSGLYLVRAAHVTLKVVVR